MSSHTDRGRPPADGDVSRPIVVTPTFLREWALPTPGGSKYGRGQVLVIGGARGTPGAVMLAGRSALRVGAGRLTMAVAESTAVAVAVAVPESGVVGLPENGQGSVLASVPDQLENACDRADAVLIGSGLDEPEQTAQLLQMILPVLRSSTRVVLDAYALGVLDQLGDTVTALEGRLVLTPNMEEAERLLGGDGTSVDDVAVAVTRIADRYGAVGAARAGLPTPTAICGRSPPGTAAWVPLVAATYWPARFSGCWVAARSPNRRPVGPPTSMPRRATD